MSADERGINLDELRRELSAKQGVYLQLKDEARFILERAIEVTEIKLHSITDRVKTVDSFIDKVQRKQSKKPFDEIRDIVGLRVICLFLSDIERIGEMIRSSFKVLEEDNKVEGSEVSSFGYMSVHFIATMRPEHSGPRYDSIANLPFEIQVRTIAMDAWANVSHYLDYKTDKDVPSDLRRDFYALSGLFYVADRHFEMFFLSRQASQEKMTELFEKATPEIQAEQEINLDSLTAYMNVKMPDRKHSPPRDVSELVDELQEAGYKSIGEVDRLLDSTLEAFKVYEKDHGRKPKYYSDIGVVRVSACIADDNFLGVYSGGSRVALELHRERYRKYRDLLK